MVVISQDNTHTNRYIHLHYLKTSAPETEFNYTITWQYIILSIWLSVYSYISVCCGNFLREFRFAEVILPWKYVSSNETRWTATNNSIYSYLTNLNVEGLNLSVELAIRWGLIFLIFVGQTGGTWRKCCKSNHKPKQTLSLAPSLSLSLSLSLSISFTGLSFKQMEVSEVRWYLQIIRIIWENCKKSLAWNKAGIGIVTSIPSVQRGDDVRLL